MILLQQNDWFIFTILKLRLQHSLHYFWVRCWWILLFLCISPEAGALNLSKAMEEHGQLRPSTESPNSFGSKRIADSPKATHLWQKECRKWDELHLVSMPSNGSSNTFGSNTFGTRTVETLNIEWSAVEQLIDLLLLQVACAGDSRQLSSTALHERVWSPMSFLVLRLDKNKITDAAIMSFARAQGLFSIHKADRCRAARVFVWHFMLGFLLSRSAPLYVWTRRTTFLWTFGGVHLHPFSTGKTLKWKTAGHDVQPLGQSIKALWWGQHLGQKSFFPAANTTGIYDWNQDSLRNLNVAAMTVRCSRVDKSALMWQGM